MEPENMIGKTVKLDNEYDAIIVAYVGIKYGNYIFIAISDDLSKPNEQIYLYLSNTDLDNWAECPWCYDWGIR